MQIIPRIGRTSIHQQRKKYTEMEFLNQNMNENALGILCSMKMRLHKSGTVLRKSE